MPRKKKSKKIEFYGDVEVVVKIRLRVNATLNSEPTPESMLEVLENGDYHDITDQEILEFQEVENIQQFEALDE